MKPVTRMAHAWTGLADLVYPPQCLACADETATQRGLCGRCWAETSFVTGPACGKCGLPVPGGAVTGGAVTDLLCDACSRHPRPWHAGTAATLYDGAARRLILGLKHAERTELAVPLAAWMARAGARLVAEADLVLPIPMHWLRLLRRGHNQAALLARALARHSGRDFAADLLLRRHARSQKDLDAAARLANLSAAIRPSAGAGLGGRRILLVDDVMTTGATLTAATRACLAGGAARVDILVLARVPPALPGLGRPHMHAHMHGADCNPTANPCTLPAHSKRQGSLMKQVEIYTTPTCGFCAMAKRLLTSKDIPFTEIDVSREPSLRQAMMQRANGRHTVPQIFIDGAGIGGCDELHALERAGKLDALVA